MRWNLPIGRSMSLASISPSVRVGLNTMENLGQTYFQVPGRSSGHERRGALQSLLLRTQYRL
jgi:hypothetical protein